MQVISTKVNYLTTAVFSYQEQITTSKSIFSLIITTAIHIILNHFC